MVTTKIFLKKMCTFDYSRRFFHSEKKRKTSFSFAFLSLNRNIGFAEITFARIKKKNSDLFYLSLAYS